MNILSAAQMRALDRHAIDDLGIPGLRLMERAGAAVAEAARARCPEGAGVLVLCGKGNNGGDGLVAARLLHEAGLSVHLHLPFLGSELSPDARVMYERARDAGVPVLDRLGDAQLADAGVVIDALLGTGVTGAVQGVLAGLIARTNAVRDGRGVLAVDVPSGVETDTGQVPGAAMRAEVTVTMARPKPCLLLYPAAAYAGRWVAVDIGFPAAVVDGWPATAEITEPAQAAAWLPQRPPTAHKGSVGWVLLIAGSFGMTGAAAMVALSAYRSGAGLVRLALPAPLVPALNAALAEVVFRPLPGTAAGTLGFRAVEVLLREAEEVRAVLIGPGLSRHAAAAHAIRRLVPALPVPLVVDADALTAMAGHDDLWRGRAHPTVITPHPGEMLRLLHKPVAALERDRIGTAKEAAKLFGAVTVYKGMPTVIADPEGRAFVNPTGTPALAVAGTGDVLAGSITALLAQGLAPLHAAVLATYAGGLAAERLSARQGVIGTTALDLLDALPAAWRAIGEVGHAER